jgi:predicted NBD/HSP70 family sugar kinase
MTPEEFADSVRENNDTTLSRLGSSKSLYAATGGEMDADAVLAAAADAEHHARETLRAWADDEDDPAAREVFAETADEEADHYETAVAELDGSHNPAGEVPAIQAYLRDRHDTVERVGALVGRALAADQSKRQLAGFFVGQAAPGTADTFRDLRGDVEDQRDRALAILGELCDDDADWARAREAATGAIQAAYDEYVEQLESMGVNPKPVC